MSGPTASRSFWNPWAMRSRSLLVRWRLSALVARLFELGIVLQIKIICVGFDGSNAKPVVLHVRGELPARCRIQNILGIERPVSAHTVAILPPRSFTTGAPRIFPAKSHKAISTPVIAVTVTPTSPPDPPVYRAILVQRGSMSSGSSPIT